MENTPAFMENAGVFFFFNAKHGVFWAVFGRPPKIGRVLGGFFCRKWLKSLVLGGLGGLGGVLREAL